MNRIVNPEGIIQHPDIPHAFIYGGRGLHAQHLIQKGLLVPGQEGKDAHFFFLPISIVGNAIREIIKSEGIKQPQVVSFSGMMTKTKSGIPAMHYLFGPGATTNLKVVVANNFEGGYSPLVQRLLQQAQSKGLKIIESSRIEHDRKMGIIQGLMHLWLVLVGRHQTDAVKTSLIEPWRTPIQTIVEMIDESVYAEEAIKELFAILPHHDYDLGKALITIVKKHLTEEDIANFGTPNSDRVLRYLAGTDEKIVTSREEIDAIRAALNNSGEAFLEQQVNLIRVSKVA